MLTYSCIKWSGLLFRDLKNLNALRMQIFMIEKLRLFCRGKLNSEHKQQTTSILII